MVDKARQWTDKELKQMEKRVATIYSEAYDDISKKWDKYMADHKPKLDKAYDDLQAAIKSGDNAAISEARAIYERTAKNITLNDQRFKEMRDEVAEKISHTNEVALEYLNGNMTSIYTVNYNAFGDVEVKGYSFSLVNEQAIKELATKDKALLPKKKIDVPKDLKWNEKMINSQILQGILQGENIPKMADRLGTVIGMNRVSAIRNARTMTTAAENKGRQDSFKKAQDDGVIMTREWVATNDERTRAWHSDLDGVEVDIDEAWENDYGSIMYPGDPDADPANVYNCRCSIRAKVKGFKWNEEDTSEENEGVEADIEEEESKPSDNLTFADGTSEEQQELISELYDEYDSRLQKVNRGAHHAAGDVDITGEIMRLSSRDPITAVHEFAHTLANTRADKYGLTNNQDFWNEIRRVRTQYRKAIREDYGKIISTYADSSNILDEFMAEAFTQAKSVEMGFDMPSKYGNDLTYANMALEIIDKYFRRKHK